MPFKSKAQQRFFYSAEARGKLPKGTARRWAEETKAHGGFKRLPEHVKKAMELIDAELKTAAHKCKTQQPYTVSVSRGKSRISNSNKGRFRYPGTPAQKKAAAEAAKRLFG